MKQTQPSRSSHDRTINSSTKTTKNRKTMISMPCPHTQTLTQMNHPQPSHPSAALFSSNIIWSGPLSQHPLPPARHQPHPLISTAHGIIQEEKNPEKRSIYQQIIFICLGLRIQNPAIREVVTRLTG